MRPAGIAAAVLFLFTFTSQAQVKVGLPAGAADPSAILDASNTGGGNKGFLAPQVALTALNAASPVTAPANGLLVYNTATAGTSPNNVMPGYYYWNGTQWVMIIGSTMPNPSGNIYTNDGTLAGNRTVTMGANSLNFAGANGNLAIATNGNIGVGTTTPAATLDVNGTARVQKVNQVAATTAISPLFVDGSGNIVKSSAPTSFGATVFGASASLAAGATGILTANLIDGAGYRAVVSVGNSCLATAVAEYYIISISYAGQFAIRGLGGIANTTNGASNNYGPSFNHISGASVATTWAATACGNGSIDNSTSLNYTLTLSSATVLTVTNNGNSGKNYNIVLTRIY